MTTHSVVIAGAGLVTGVGLSLAETAASVRAGTSRFVESHWQDKAYEPFTLAEVPDDGLPDLADGVNRAGLRAREVRLLRLATNALREAVAHLPAAGPRPPLVLALPEPVPGERRLDGPAFLARLVAQTDSAFDLPRSDASQRGRAGGLVAVGIAAEAIRQGQATVVLAGGVDTYWDAFVLSTLDLEGRVKSATNLDGFIPGEGAAFVLLANGNAPPAGLRRLGELSPMAYAAEPGHLRSTEVYRGEGLAVAVQQLVDAGAASAPIAEVYSSMNGESHWAKEWGVTHIRCGPAFAGEHGMHHPAECFGDIGAAAGPALVGLSAVGISNGYRRSPALVYASSDTGARAALVVRRT